MSSPATASTSQQSLPRGIGGKFAHPWLAPLSAGKTHAYNIAHRTVVTALIAFSAYAFMEVGRGTYFILKHNRDTAVAAHHQQQESEKPATH